jgi:hypothetical protein
MGPSAAGLVGRCAISGKGRATGFRIRQFESQGTIPREKGSDVVVRAALSTTSDLAGPNSVGTELAT